MSLLLKIAHFFRGCRVTLTNKHNIATRAPTDNNKAYRKTRNFSWHQLYFVLNSLSSESECSFFIGLKRFQLHSRKFIDNYNMP